jgi:hypothetical protein
MERSYNSDKRLSSQMYIMFELNIITILLIDSYPQNYSSWTYVSCKTNRKGNLYETGNNYIENIILAHIH